MSGPTPRYRAYAYPWDLGAPDPDTAVAELADVGIDTVSVCPVYHRVQCVLPRNGARRTFIADASYAYFSPDPTRYDAIGLEPAVHPDRSERRFGAVADAAQRRGLGISAWVIALHYSPHFARYRGFATHNLWDERNPHSLCPSHPEVRRYLGALAADLVDQFGVDEIELETPHWDVFFNSVHGIHERIGVTFDPVDVLAMSLCFCAACTAGASEAGVDVGALRATLADKVGDTLRTGRGSLSTAPPGETGAWLSAVPDLPAFLGYRRGVTTELVRTVRDSASCPVSVMYDPWDGYALDAAALAALGVRLTGLTYSPDTEAVRERAAALLQQHSPATDWRFVLSLFARDVPERDTLRNHAAALAELGITDVGFYNSSLASDGALAALRHARTDTAHGQGRRGPAIEVEGR